MHRKRLKPEEGSLKVYAMTNVPHGDTREYPVRGPKHGALLIQLLAESQLLDPSIETNVFGLLIFNNGDWEDWESEEGETIQEYRETQGWDCEIT